jgi:hypothetical protein
MINWREVWNVESDESKWEIINNFDDKKIKLLYVPEEDYNEKDIEIEVSYDDFEDLVKFIKSLS